MSKMSNQIKQADISEEKLLKDVLDSSPNGIIYLEPKKNKKEIVDFIFLIANGEARRLANKNESEIVNKGLLQLYPGLAGSMLFNKCAEVFNKDITYEIERLYKTDILNCWLKVIAKRSGEGIIINFSDVNSLKIANKKLKKAKKQLIKQEKKYQELFEKSIDPIFLTTPELQFTDVNEAMANLLGYTKDELSTLSMNIKSLMARKQDFLLLNQKISKNGYVRDHEIVLHNRSGKELICLLNLAKLSIQDEGFSVYQGIIRDITVRKQAEQDILMAEKMAVTGKIARSIAHEVRNPLTNLHLSLEQLKEEIPKTVESSELYLDIIKRNADRIGQLITELLNSSKPKPLQLKENSLNLVIEEALSLAADRLELKGMKLQKKLDDSIAPIPLDLEQLKVSFLNMFINAIEAMKPDVGVLVVTSYLKENKIGVSIQDNGKGIATKNIGDLFDPYFTVKKSGMGLGLTAVRSIINGHGGSIQVESEVGKGTTFYISFPIP